MEGGWGGFDVSDVAGVSSSAAILAVIWARILAVSSTVSS